MATEPAANVAPTDGVDPNVFVPKHVRDAAAAADAIHKQAYEPPQQTEQQVQQTEQQQVQQTEQQVQQTEQQVQQPAVTATVTDNFTAAPSDQELRDSTWAQRYNSMRGRWESSQRQIGAMQDQMNQLASELARTQNLLLQNGPTTTAAPQTQRGQDHEHLITAQDRETYGDELIDVARRAGLEAVKPELDALKSENADLKRRVITNDQKAIYGQLARAVPTWRAINGDPNFKSWLSLPNVYTGQVRGQMLNAAFQAADAPRVVAIFQDFVKEVMATGGVVPGTQPAAQQQTTTSGQQQQSREPALSLETLAAPGRARPAGGDTPNTPAEKPTYTRQQIAQFYSDVRKGGYAGRDADKNRIEADIIAAQSEGRVRG